ncbi:MULTISPECIES: RNA polymerase sigma factor SigZ [unclassified Aureispira]|uniref:RNA polymerase sigma factor SigZ n=1 Tax=unclassified Aureispira TaxID=2649989 RepID=UPI0006979988|nr:MULTISPECIES: RNA polymerase sigma factor SigZ [unclassified Aureispira]WMX15892.1 RNA polymerase sigma factor SigZ [Aureispira sp. CCB-E]
MNTLIAWNKINARLTNFVLGKVKDKDLTNDIVQDVFLKVFTKIDTLKDNNKLVSWIYQIARNEIISHFRKVKHDGWEEIEIPETKKETLTSELAECLHPLIDTLPDKYKEALILADIEKVPQKEIAKRLNISYSGAKSRVQRGREMLKSTLYQCCTITTDVYGDILYYKQNNCEEGKSNNCKINCD